MGEHVQVRALEHMAGSAERPLIAYGVETRDRPGPAYKAGVFSDDVVWIQVRGGLLVAKAAVKIAWRGEYSRIDEIRRRVNDPHLPESFWAGRPRAGYAVVADLHQARWVDPVWAGPRTYGYEWIVLEDGAKRKGWLDPKSPPRDGEGLFAEFLAARAGGFAR
jgi:hypothetical protein